MASLLELRGHRSVSVREVLSQVDAGHSSCSSDLRVWPPHPAQLCPCVRSSVWFGQSFQHVLSTVRSACHLTDPPTALAGARVCPVLQMGKLRLRAASCTLGGRWRPRPEAASLGSRLWPPPSSQLCALWALRGEDEGVLLTCRQLRL